MNRSTQGHAEIALFIWVLFDPQVQGCYNSHTTLARGGAVWQLVGLITRRS